MTTLALKRVTPELLNRLERLAAEHGADLESEALRCLERGLTEQEETEKELGELRELRGGAKEVYLTDEMIDRAKREGLA